MISEFALFVFTTLGGVAVGLYASSAVCKVEGKRHNLLLTIVPLVLLAVGGVALMLHLGHPERMLNAFTNLSAGIAMEGIATMAFGAVVFLDAILTLADRTTPRALRIAGAVAGIALTLVMGYTYYMYESVSCWHNVSTVPFFMLCDLGCGSLLFGALMGEARERASFVVLETVLAAIAAVMFVIEGTVISGAGLSIVPFIAAAVLAAIAAVLAKMSGSKKSASAAWVAFTLMFVALVAARYTFYSVI